MDFAGKVVLVTGASAGIGEVIALSFAERGAKLSLVGRNEENLMNVADRCKQEKGEDVIAIVADLSTDEGCEKTAKMTLDHFGRLDVLINNAGVGARTTIQQTDMATYDRVFATNVRGVYNLTRLLVPALVAAAGNIVNISSVSGSMPNVGSLPYSMTKAALDHFTKCIALELAPKGVRVNAVSPGFTRSSFVTRLTGYTEEQYSAWLQEASRGVPLGRVCSGRDVAHAVLAVAAAGAGALTGVIIPVDGGLALAGTGNDSQIMKKQIQTETENLSS